MTRQPQDELAQAAPAADAPLSELQMWMAHLLRQRRSLTKHKALQEAAAVHFTGNERLSPAEQIDIYRKQFWLRHTSALVEDFPGLTGLLGQKAWEPIVEEYLTTSGYDIFALKHLGKNMAGFLEGLDPSMIETTGLDRHLLVDMARLEWAYVRAFDVEDDPPLSPGKLAQIPPDAWSEARFVLSPSLTLLKLDYPVADLRRTLRSGNEAVDAHSVEKAPHNLVVYRRDRSLWDKRISDAAFLLLRQFEQNVALVPACEAVVARDPSAEQVLSEQLTDWFSLWGRLGWIVDVRL